MKSLTIPSQLNIGDIVATVSLSSGCAGDYPVDLRYKIGIERMKNEFGLNAISMPNSMKGSKYIYENPKARAEDLMEAFERKDVKAIISNVGGEDCVRILPYLDYSLIRKNPKIVLGFSDFTTIHLLCYYCGLRSYYGPAVLTDFAENVNMYNYTKKWIKKTLFSSDVIGNIYSSKYWTSQRLEWAEVSNNNIKREVYPHEGVKLIQGKGVVRGHLLGGCINVLDRLRGLNIFPCIDEWDGAILFIETSNSELSPQMSRYFLRSLAALGVFEKIEGIVFGKPYNNLYYDEFNAELLRIVAYEQGRDNLPILCNLNFGHTSPSFIIPYGAEAEIDCNCKRFSIISKGVNG